METTKRDEHRRVFLEANGSGPFPCWLCAGEVMNNNSFPLTKESLVVHHRNGDRTDNGADNLVAVHHGCNTSRHKLQLWGESPDPLLRRRAESIRRRLSNAAN